MPAPYEIRRYTIDPANPVDIVPPFPCNSITLLQEDQGNGAWFYTTPGDTATRKRILAGSELQLPPGGARGGHGRPSYMFLPGKVVGVVLSEAGTGPLVVEYAE